MSSDIKPARKPRRYHKKSSTGCKRCKQRKIKCDENRLPLGCKNCQRHKFACSFVEDQDAWKPFPCRDGDGSTGSRYKGRTAGLACTASYGLLLQLRSRFTAGCNGLQITDYLFVYHTVTTAAEMSSQNRSQCTKWINDLPRLLVASTSMPFALHTLIAFCVQHAFWSCEVPPEMLQRLFYHRGEALKGIREQIQWLSSSRSEHVESGMICTQPPSKSAEAIAITAAFLLAQTVEWQDWVSLIRGLRPVFEPTSSRGTSIFGYKLFLLPLPSPKVRAAQSSVRPTMTTNFLLPAVCMALESLTARILDNDVLTNVRHLCLWLFELQVEGLSGTPSRLLERLQPLRSILFWFPSALLEGDSLDTTKAAILALTYAAGLCLEQAYVNVHLDCQEISGGPVSETVQLECISSYLGGPFLSLGREAFQLFRSFKSSEDLPQVISTVEHVLKSCITSTYDS